MSKRVLILAGLMAGLAVTPALACSPAPMKPSSTPTRGGNCAINWQVSEYGMVALGAAERLPGGFTLQRSFEGNACNGSTSLIVADCNRGEVVILGELQYDLMQPGLMKAGEQFEADLARLGKQGLLTLEAAQDAAERRGLTRAAWAETRDSIRMSGKSAKLDCSCKTFWPKAGGKG